MVTRWAAHKPAYRFAANWFPDSALAKLFPLTANKPLLRNLANFRRMPAYVPN
jgi:hypothetical protein